MNEQTFDPMFAAYAGTERGKRSWRRGQPQKIGSPLFSIQSSSTWTFLFGRLRLYS